MFLDSFNDRIMKDYGVSRRERFVEERSKLLPQSPEPYSIFEWKEAKVHPDCNIQIYHNYYSVPFQYVGQTVRVRCSEGLIEIFDQELVSLTAHARLDGKGKRSSYDEHFPEERLQTSRFEVKQAKARAEAIGPKFFELISQLFSIPRPLVNLRRVQGMLRLWNRDGLNNAAFEYAASQCLTFKRFRLEFFKSCAQSFVSRGGRMQVLTPTRCTDDIFLHVNGKE